MNVWEPGNEMLLPTSTFIQISWIIPCTHGMQSDLVSVSARWTTLGDDFPAVSERQSQQKAQLLGFTSLIMTFLDIRVAHSWWSRAACLSSARAGDGRGSFTQRAVIFQGRRFKPRQQCRSVMWSWCSTGLTPLSVPAMPLLRSDTSKLGNESSLRARNVSCNSFVAEGPKQTGQATGVKKS